MSILECLNEGRLVARKWEATDFEGRQLLCLYTAMIGDPEARPGSCPSDICPIWLAYTLPFLDDSVMDAGTGPIWYNLMQRIGMMADKFPKLSIFVYYRMLLKVVMLHQAWSEYANDELEHLRLRLENAIKQEKEISSSYIYTRNRLAMFVENAIMNPAKLEKVLSMATFFNGHRAVANYKSEHLVHCIVQLLEEECSKL